MKHHLATLKKDKQVIRFFDKHRWLLKDSRFRSEARLQLKRHTASLALQRKKILHVQAALRAAVVKRAHLKKLQRLAALRRASPATAICKVFGSHCREAITVSRCESGLRTDAHNGQYLGLFQMGSRERQLFGHGPTALAQVTAAHRYFVASGATWRPWSCKPWS